MIKPILLRKRFIPQETVNISNDQLLFRSSDLLVTRWKSIRPRSDFYGGISYTFLNDGFKISKFYDDKCNFLYWYCDIINVLYDEGTDTYTFEDLLVDIKMMPDRGIKVLDADELAQALENGLISSELACKALRILNNLLNLMYEDKFPPKVCKDYEY